MKFRRGETRHAQHPVRRWPSVVQLGLAALLTSAGLSPFAVAQGGMSDPELTVIRGAEASPPVVPREFEGDLRVLPTIHPWQLGDPVGEANRRRTQPPLLSSAPSPGQPDPLLALQSGIRLRSLAPRVFSPPELNFDGPGFNGVAPPDTVGDIGPDYYIHAINHPSGTAVTVYNKTTGAIAAGPFTLQSLWMAGGACASGSGDPVVLYDPLASRWLLSEFASFGNHLCVYISRNHDPIAGGWLNYDFAVPQFPDYAKLAVWPDAYYVTTNESQPAMYALDRTKMIAGLPASFQRFTAPLLGGFAFQTLTPGDLDGSTPPPAGSPAFFARHVDDEAHNPGSNDPTKDFLEIWQFHVDFATPANSTFGLAATIPVAEFDSDLCGLTSFECIPQPSTAVGLDPLREVVMWRLQYRNFGAYQALVGNFVTDVSGTDHAGVRWFELRRTGLGAWSLYQEGTYAPDAHHRWLGSIAMDGSGNMALGYSISSSSVFPGMRYTGRLSSDPLGAMTQGEVTVVNGAGSQTGFSRWGDYASMNVDPVDDCSFWFTNEYVPASGNWKTRIARFRYNSPVCVNGPAPTCGNNIKEIGEDCDGSDGGFCPGLCQAGCTCPAPACGNNVAEVGEECDGTDSGACTGGCTATCSCELCGAAPADGCRQAMPGKSSVLIIDNSTDASRDKLRWLWNKGDATDITAFANPVTGNPQYAICVYDGSASPQPLLSVPVTPGGTCDGVPCWKQTSSGYRYRNRFGNGAGITQLNLKAGISGRAQVKLHGKGTALNPPNPALTLPVTVQLSVKNGASTTCWQTQYTTFRRNDDQQFKATGP